MIGASFLLYTTIWFYFRAYVSNKKIWRMAFNMLLIVGYIALIIYWEYKIVII
jgi:VIT1/CCC1 family predicted Fe2+/Mn2+ transporter